MDSPVWFRQIREEGFAICGGVISEREIGSLIAALQSIPSDSRRRRGGIRNLLDVSIDVLRLSESRSIRAMVDSVVGEDAVPVRGILFDKTESSNWKVPWHQDLTIAVAEKVETNGFGPWSMKAGVHHVQPPASILENMLSVRIHLDHCPAENGALRVVPGSHNAGRLSEADAARFGAEGPVAMCIAKAGDVVLMRPLLVHASSASEAATHRRVIHLDYASGKLPNRLRWLHQRN